MVQWSGLHASTAGGPDLGIKIPQAPWCSQMNEWMNEWISIEKQLKINIYGIVRRRDTLGLIKWSRFACIVRKKSDEKQKYFDYHFLLNYLNTFRRTVWKGYELLVRTAPGNGMPGCSEGWASVFTSTAHLYTAGYSRACPVLQHF